MDYDILATVIAGILLVIAAVGGAHPVLPGSLIAIEDVAGLGLDHRLVAGLGGGGDRHAALRRRVVGDVLTGRKLKELEVPKWSIPVAALAGLIGMFLIPVVGIFVGFAVGLLVSEAVRHRDVRRPGHTQPPDAEGHGRRRAGRVRHAVRSRGRGRPACSIVHFATPVDGLGHAELSASVDGPAAERRSRQEQVG